MIVDFHSHTKESDGSLTPQALADYMGEREVEVFSISDHDTLSAYGAFRLPPGARVVTGIEINTTWRDNEVHLLGYALPLDDVSPLTAMLERNRAERRTRVTSMVEQLQAGGYRIVLDDVLREAVGSKSLGRPHVAKALVRMGAAGDVESVFRLLLRRGRPGYVPSIHITPQEAIARIRDCGGTAVLAHPGRLKDRAIIDALVPSGLHGLEVFYPQHDADDVRFFTEKAREHRLVMTAGSDFHDIRYHRHGVGMDVDREAIAPFLERVGVA
ncbi:MAG TPA: PHP domain-containing protein [Candidatus Tyrphobacter sp.]